MRNPTTFDELPPRDPDHEARLRMLREAITGSPTGEAADIPASLADQMTAVLEDFQQALHTLHELTFEWDPDDRVMMSPLIQKVLTAVVDEYIRTVIQGGHTHDHNR